MTELLSGYGIPYQPASVIDRLESGDEGALDELWENLYRQGDIGTASLAAVPRLVNLGALSLVSAIAVAREENPGLEVPEEIQTAYSQALEVALAANPDDEADLQGFYAINALKKGHLRLAKAINLMCTEDLSDYG